MPVVTTQPEMLTSGPSRSYRVAKRAFDTAAALAAMLILLPVLAVIAVAIRADTQGPALYTQMRSGRERRPFRMYKFRTMSVDADDLLVDVLERNLHASSGDLRLYKIDADPRVTRVGAFLRRHSLDELPQLINVVLGDMSLVGPRPLMLVEDRHVTGAALARATVRPGITGPWQVRGRNELSFEQMMTLDLGYVGRMSFGIDLVLLLRTVPVVLRRQRDC